MKKKIITLALAAALLIGALCMGGCSKYNSKYNAVGFVHSNTSKSAFMTFYSFDGTMAFKLKCGSESAGNIKYSAKLESGSITVYYDNDGTRTEWFSLSAGEEAEASVGPFGDGTVYVIVETDGKCMNGDLRFDVE